MNESRIQYNNGYLFLPVDWSESLPEQVRYLNQTLYRKSELHVSLVCVKKLAAMVSPADTDAASKYILEAVDSFRRSYPGTLNIFTPTGEYRYVTKDDRRSIIAMVEVDGLEALFEHLRSYIHTDLPTQTAHVTLFTASPDKGIGILSNEELMATSVIIEPETIELINS